MLSIIVNLLMCPLDILLNALFVTSMWTSDHAQHTVGVYGRNRSGGGDRLSAGFRRATTSCLCLLSLLHLALMALERFVAMKYSLRYDSILTKFRVTVAVACCWLIMIFSYWSTWLFYKLLISPLVFIIARFY